MTSAPFSVTRSTRSDAISPARVVRIRYIDGDGVPQPGRRVERLMGDIQQTLRMGWNVVHELDEPILGYDSVIELNLRINSPGSIPSYALAKTVPWW